MLHGCIVRTKKRNKLSFKLLNQQTVFGRLIWRDFPEVLILSRAFDCAVMVTAMGGVCWCHSAPRLMRGWKPRWTSFTSYFGAQLLMSAVRPSSNLYPEDKVDISASFRLSLTLHPGQVRRVSRNIPATFCAFFPLPDEHFGALGEKRGGKHLTAMRSPGRQERMRR